MGTRALLILLSAAVCRADRCDAPPALAEFQRSLPAENHERRKRIEERLNANPAGFWLNRLFLETAIYERLAIRERYRARAAAEPSSANQYLYGRSLVGFDTKQALAIYAGILKSDPDNPWVHYSQLQIYSSPVFRDRAKLTASFDALARVCPSWVEPYRFLPELEGEAAARHAGRLRTLLDVSSNPKELELYRSLWAVEFRAQPDVARERLKEDLRGLKLIKGAEATLAAGARLAGNEGYAQHVNPPGPPDEHQAWEQWQKAHPYPNSSDTVAMRAWDRELLAAATKWVEDFPNSVFVASQRLYALERLGAPEPELVQTADGVIRRARSEPWPGSNMSFLLGVIQTFVKRGIELDRVPGLVREALAAFDDPEAVIELDFSPAPAINAQHRSYLATLHVNAVLELSRYYQKVGRMNEARKALDPLPAYLEQAFAPRSSADPYSTHNPQRAFAKQSYRIRLAEIDEAYNRKVEALNGYREAVAEYGSARSHLLARQRRLWKELGRSDEAWQAWLDALPAPPANAPRPVPKETWTAVHRPLPKTILRDLDGKEWPAAEFMKTTIATVWATWCGPCRIELSYFTKLAERLKDRPDVQVVTFNTDENPETARLFVAQNGYRFTVLAARNFAEDLMPYMSIPRTWVIRDGVIVEEQEGFGKDGDQWVDRLVARLK